MSIIKAFEEGKIERIKNQGNSESLKKATDNFVLESIKSEYSYNFNWMGRPIIQYPQDIIAMQEIAWVHCCYLGHMAGLATNLISI